MGIRNAHSCLAKKKDDPDNLLSFESEHPSRGPARMTLAQKVGQMTQAEAPDITPEDVRAYVSARC